MLDHFRAEIIDTWRVAERERRYTALLFYLVVNL